MVSEEDEYWTCWYYLSEEDWTEGFKWVFDLKKIKFNLNKRMGFCQKRSFNCLARNQAEYFKTNATLRRYFGIVIHSKNVGYNEKPAALLQHLFNLFPGSPRNESHTFLGLFLTSNCRIYFMSVSPELQFGNIPVASPTHFIILSTETMFNKFLKYL